MPHKKEEITSLTKSIKTDTSDVMSAAQRLQQDREREQSIQEEGRRKKTNK